MGWIHPRRFTPWIYDRTLLNNGVRRPRQIRGPKIRANVPPKGRRWRHRVCHLVRLSSLGQHVGVLALAGYKRRKSALAAGPIVYGAKFLWLAHGYRRLLFVCVFFGGSSVFSVNGLTYIYNQTRGSTNKHNVKAGTRHCFCFVSFLCIWYFSTVNFMTYVIVPLSNCGVPQIDIVNRQDRFIGWTDKLSFEVGSTT